MKSLLVLLLVVMLSANEHLMELNKITKDIEEHFKSEVIITSFIRDKKHNKEVGGSKHSYHLRAMAYDIVVVGTKQKEVCRYLKKKYTSKYGIGCYNKHTHIDVRKRKSRW